MRRLLIIIIAMWLCASCSNPTKPPDEKQDKVPPTVKSVVPSDSTNCATDYVIPEVLFSEDILSQTLNSGTFKIFREGTTQPVAGEIHAVGDTARFIPDTNFVCGYFYSAIITTGVKDKAGNPLQEDYNWGFFVAKDSVVVVDTIPPRLILSTPQNGATNIPIDIGTLSDVFSEVMDASTFTAQSYYLTQNDTLIPTTPGYSGVKATLAIAQNLEYETDYVIHMTSDLTDTAGNALPPTTRGFRTEKDPNPPDITPPTVVSSTPVDGATNISIGISELTDTFSEVMDASTFTAQSYYLTQNDTLIPTTPGYSGVKATLAIAQNLEYETDYVIHMTSDLTDTAGNALTAQTRSFRTEADPTPPYTTRDGITIKILDFDNQGNLFFAGQEPGYQSLPSNDASIIGKFDSQGKLKWLEKMPVHSTYYDQSFGVATDGNSAVLIRTQDPFGNGFGNVYLDRRNAQNGDSIWTIYLDGSNQIGVDVDMYGQYIYAATISDLYQIDMNGNVVNSVSCATRIRSVVANEHGVFIGCGVYTMYLKSYDHNLNENWVRDYDTPLIDTGGWVVVSGNYIYMAGGSGDPLNSIPVEPVLLKYNLSGDLQFDSTYVGVQPPGNYWRRCITADQSGNVYMVSGPVKFSPSGEKLWEFDIAAHHIKERNGKLYVADNKTNNVLIFDTITGAQL